MIFPGQWKSIVAPVAVVVAVAVALGTSPGVARADVAFRKKPAAKAEPAATGGEPGTDADTAPKGPIKLQAQDPDDPGNAEAKAAAAAAAAALVAKPVPPPPGPPIYKQWKFWAVAGAAVVGAVALVWGTSALVHAANGGDVKSCPNTDVGCFGEGR
ncbi:MAG TPA: hypothetical protein VH374_15805 [Polyangia bacterium]|jgi:hypothetical protein|nr:hypothetical protein [Polyangia bacterium]